MYGSVMTEPSTVHNSTYATKKGKKAMQKGKERKKMGT
jgi:hypothetical protein